MEKRIEIVRAFKAYMLTALFVAFLTLDALAIHHVDDTDNTISTFSQVEESTLVLRELGNESGQFNFSSSQSFCKSRGLDTVQYWLLLEVDFPSFDVTPAQRSTIYVFISAKAP